MYRKDNHSCLISVWAAVVGATHEVDRQQINKLTDSMRKEITENGDYWTRRREREEERGEEERGEVARGEEEERRGQRDRIQEDHEEEEMRQRIGGANTWMQRRPWIIQPLCQAQHQPLQHPPVLASVPGCNINVAVKMISKRDNEDTIMRERRILLAARHCPFLCHLSQHRAYLITEYLSGGSLEDLIRMCGCLNIGNVRFYTAEMVSPPRTQHRPPISYFVFFFHCRDIKPDNIMLDADGHIRIIDLGLAQDGVSSSKNISEVTGTFHYMAPEVHRRKWYGAAVDWWSLGIVVSRMAAGRSPFYNGPVKQMAFKAIINKKPKFPSWLDADAKHLIKKLLRKDPQTRLGVSGNIQEHPFFTTIGWEDLEERRVEPPFTPFRPVLENHHLQWPEHTVFHPMAGFTYVDEKIWTVKGSTTIGCGTWPGREGVAGWRTSWRRFLEHKEPRAPGQGEPGHRNVYRLRQVRSDLGAPPGTLQRVQAVVMLSGLTRPPAGIH
ncbi:unnamed protein product [Ranitomeya imitator]|uniref:Protein kinase domain-containing protein n=1 Tax=Ranitomeya imitator TaxID=111125 RepID=A0ABN9KUU4_9NEOB|nr:unnamed protein product [Ranitomeya imitator]